VTKNISGAPDAMAAGPRSEIVPAHSLFLVGDNAANSIDSRNFGAVPQEEVRGRLLLSMRPAAVGLGFAAVAFVLAAAWIEGRGQQR
jgi:hypothetical protein